MGIGFEITLIFLLVLANGFFAMAEIAVVSARKVRLHQQAAEGNRKAQAALELANTPGVFLPTVQIGVTLVSTLAGAFGGATLAVRLAAEIRLNPTLAPYSETIGITIVVLSISYLSLILGELVPKRLALGNPEGVAAAVAPLMRLLGRATSPAVRFLGWSTEAALRLLPIKRTEEPTVTEEEVKGLIEQGTQDGTFEEAEQEMVEGVFRLADHRAAELMTPRMKVVWISMDDEPGEVERKITQSRYSRFPVARDNLDELLGVVYVKDLLSRSLMGQPVDLEASLRKPLFVPETKRALEVLELFQTTGIHIAIVIGEHGGVEGILTLTDLIEAVVGDLASVGERPRPGMTLREDGSWLVDGMLPLADLKEALAVTRLPGEVHGGFTTAAGFVVTSLGRIPSPAEHFECLGWRFEVVDMDGNRVDKLLVSRVAPPSPPEGEDGERADS
jgi:putative hemolysin